MQTVMSAALVLGAGAAVDLAIARFMARVHAWRARRSARRHDPDVLAREAEIFAAEVRCRIAEAGYTIEVTRDRFGRPCHYAAVPFPKPIQQMTHPPVSKRSAAPRRTRHKPAHTRFSEYNAGYAI